MSAVREIRVVRTVLLTTLCALVTGAFALLGGVANAAAPASPDGRAVTAVRGGDSLYTADGLPCTVGFNASGGGEFYGILPGHCGGQEETQWFADPQRQVPAGVTAASHGPSGYSVIHYTNPDLSYPSEVSTDSGPLRVERAADPAVGMQVCGAGQANGWHCGTVLAVDISVSFPEGTVDGLFQTDLCAEPGESGGPAVSGNAAVGVPLAADGDCASGGTSLYMPVTTALAELGLEIGY
ncbi:MULTISPECIES: S1 family peptidase [unclassified Streptomyces]|uniref:S1 family peptidase n=1 Tax=unclassified Streptomyces TaxID=2593676 RepID=UPI002DD82F75|nr:MULTISPECIES: S1 family peptidase [unclassified Streptomyces]WSA92239.1 S1 family peptidase [Streptomyces sp. NBC_01795]WSB76605.1 S1 family peptidase [Streptomyces sp. NBC_01775]WSS15108.1 S1 family peptidase [Streptomyces sp. NBC_01186]WSS43951.1 S1 family peptidase [Streptomyces sp. NBC_01187]